MASELPWYKVYCAVYATAASPSMPGGGALAQPLLLYLTTALWDLGGASFLSRGLQLFVLGGSVFFLAGFSFSSIACLIFFLILLVSVS